MHAGNSVNIVLSTYYVCSSNDLLAELKRIGDSPLGLKLNKIQVKPNHKIGWEALRIARGAFLFIEKGNRL